MDRPFTVQTENCPLITLHERFTHSTVLFVSLWVYSMCLSCSYDLRRVCLTAGGREGEAEEARGAADGFDQQLSRAAHPETIGQEPGGALQHRRHIHRLPDARQVQRHHQEQR